MKGFGVDEKAVTRVLANADALKVAAISQAYNQRFMRDLQTDLVKELSGDLEKAVIATVRGPLKSDVVQLQEATKGLGTKEQLIDDVLACRSNADINAIKAEYQATYRRSLEADLKGDLSGATEQMFMILLAARRNEDSAYVDQAAVDNDAQRLQAASGSTVGKDAVGFCEILLTRNDAQLKAINTAFQTKYRKPLMTHIKSQFSGHMEDTLCLHLSRALDRAGSDAEQLEQTMAGIGTKDDLLVQRLVRAHWNRQHMNAVSQAYKAKYRKDLKSRIEGETRGDYEKFLVALLAGA